MSCDVDVLQSKAAQRSNGGRKASVRLQEIAEAEAQSGVPHYYYCDGLNALWFGLGRGLPRLG